MSVVQIIKIETEKKYHFYRRSSDSVMLQTLSVFCLRIPDQMRMIKDASRDVRKGVQGVTNR